ncbi:hypothetical protein [Clostridium sp.]|uniref:hypothetical protein n=1 Tax=Clostridium sp. TaxID=1506 RepID=UPI002FCA6341
MNVVKKRQIYILIVLSFSFILTACGQSNLSNNGVTGNKVETLGVQNGAVLVEEKGEYKNLNLSDGKYNLIETNRAAVLEFNKESGNYVFIRDGKHYVKSGNKEEEIKDNNYSSMKLSNKGSYLSYMIYEDGYSLKVIALKDNKEVKINSKIAISGDLYGWIDDETLVYYGISDDGVNGIFTYNLNDGKEDLLYKLDGGYAEYLKGYNGNVIILQQTADEKTSLKVINKEDKKATEISDKFKDVKDVVKLNDDYYVIGTAIGDSPSVYKIKNKSYERLVYSFPSKINMDKGLSIGDNGDLLFIGTNGTSKEENVFSFKDGTVSLVSTNPGEYNFISIN